jgi:hypothetical protein
LIWPQECVGENIRLGLGENIRLGLEGYLWVKDTMTVTLKYPDWIHGVENIGLGIKGIFG